MTMHSATQFGGEVSSVTLPPASLTVFVVEVASPSFEIGGLVRDTAGRPLAGVTVEATHGLRFTDLPQGDYDIEVQPGGYIVEYGEADLTQAQYAVASFSLEPRLRGTVKLPEQQGGDPVPGAAVWVEPSGGGAVVASTTTDCEGNFTLPVAAGQYTLAVQRVADSTPTTITAYVSVSNACFSFVLGGNPPASQVSCQ